jgi:hypothetical protein
MKNMEFLCSKQQPIWDGKTGNLRKSGQGSIVWAEE